MATINDFRKWCKNNSGMIHDGFSLHEAPAPLWQRWLPKDKNRAAAIKKQLEVFGKAPDGSWYAFWKKNAQEKPVVFLSPEGEGAVLADTLEEFLRLLALPYDYSEKPNLNKPPVKNDMEDLNPDYLAWLKKLNLSLPRVGSEIVEPARAKHAEFGLWLTGEAGKEPPRKKTAPSPKPSAIPAKAGEIVIRNYFGEASGPETKERFGRLLPGADDAAERSWKKFTGFFENVVFAYDGKGAPALRVRLSDVFEKAVAIERATDSEVEKMGGEYGVSLPKPLAAFIKKVGLVSVRQARPKENGEGAEIVENRFVSEFYRREEAGDNVLPLPRAIASHFTERPLKELYDSTALALFEKEIFVFAGFSPKGQSCDYYFFNRKGGFGHFTYQDDNHPDTQKAMDALLDANNPLMSFDRLMARYLSQSLVEFASGLADF
ncbi:MAG: hypothetical protein IPK56_07565 [Elusimicrobia bacterium]|nr:hypothetical protein [Elusimicrobiota bacterium]